MYVVTESSITASPFDNECDGVMDVTGPFESKEDAMEAAKELADRCFSREDADVEDDPDCDVELQVLADEVTVQITGETHRGEEYDITYHYEIHSVNPL